MYGQGKPARGPLGYQKQQPGYQKQQAQADIIISILYIHNMLSSWMWMDCEWIVNGL
jgi:hypothetical protein